MNPLKLALLPVLAALDAKDRIIGPDIVWRRWFAWHPVRVRGQRVWLRWIERRVGVDDDEPQIVYRLIR